MRIAVTGAGGFIGANLVRRLLGEGHDVCAILRPNGSPARLAGLKITFAHADLHDPETLAQALRRHKPETVYHLASSVWGGHTSPGDHERTIVGGMANLLVACERFTPRRLIVTGSAAEYGAGTGFDEDSPCQPDTALGKVKASACRMATEEALRLGIECVWFRLFTPYGPFESPNRLVPSAIRAALSGQTLVLRSPHEERDFLAVVDAVEAMARVAWAPLPNPAILNLCSGQPTSVASLTNLIFHCAGAEPAWRQAPPSPGDTREALARSSGHNRRAREWLGWSPRLDLNTGIQHAIAWWKEQSS